MTGKLIGLLKQYRDFALLAAAMLLLLAAALHPTLPMQRDIYSYLLVVDITQSMNTQDMTLNGKPASRMAYTRQLLHDTVSSLPCGTKVAFAYFAGASVALQYSPIEVCRNFAAIQDNIDHLDWRMGRFGQGAGEIGD